MTAEAQARYVARQKANNAEDFYERERAAKRKWDRANREKNKAHCKVYRAVKNGTLIRATHCEECGRKCKTEGAHTDYSKPLEVRWLCRKCHASFDASRRLMRR